MPKRRSDANHRRFVDEFLCVKVPRLRDGIVKLDALRAVIRFGEKQMLIAIART
jgi:hypothetical protein